MQALAIRKIMKIIKGKVKNGCGHMKIRFKNYPHIFKEATGVDLYPGTINVGIDHIVKVKEDFRIKGSLIGEPNQNQDLIFEECLINGYPAFRIRPYDIITGEGGHGDDTLEISSETFIPDLGIGSTVDITLFN